jgi:hypothetical protein
VQANPHGLTLRREHASPVKPDFREKFLGLIGWVPVPQTDTRRRGENPKTRERTLVKELGKMTP